MSTEHKLKHTIYDTSRKIATDVVQAINMEIAADALDLIAELTFKKIQSWGSDLEAFQRHAKRNSVAVDDVKLLVRKNESLKELVDKKLNTMTSSKTTEPSSAPKRKRKTNSTS